MSGLLNSVQSILGKLWTNTANGFDKILPPDRRDELLSKLQDFANKNPKLAAFLATHVVLTGIPLVLFTFFILSVFVFSLITALLASILAAVFFTLFMVGVALLFLVPTLFLTTFTASFVFLWGLGGWFVLKWFTQEGSASDRKRFTSRADGFTGGRAEWVGRGAGEKRVLTHSSDEEGAERQSDSHRLSEMANVKASGTAAGRELEKVTESLEDETNRQPLHLPVKILKIVEAEENAAGAENSVVADAKETVGGAAET
ncbi:uncharacterized protein CC84DRAFT_1164146 [Paraphaeosphaeria sporulosa]|uniref:Uncharacterized protein n=1 Tax=Paraphaeosphaeria sporulosa TaxID=1460663 RepID=A0A177CEE0_9PLEO|nr:uncharacterized protein CC84DRAFT_1164146 [Paraphaeosphaeria sporulosa]OAG05676.1 hypothetical protein CC84DRAFT_1164146 [Paraphaeosphaeria sporulosa]